MVFTSFFYKGYFCSYPHNSKSFVSPTLFRSYNTHTSMNKQYVIKTETLRTKHPTVATAFQAVKVEK